MADENQKAETGKLQGKLNLICRYLKSGDVRTGKNMTRNAGELGR